jgi:rhodanese-related sulfurtransferase
MDSPEPSPLAPPEDETRDSKTRVFQLKMLHEASRELSSLSTPAQIARAFLLTALGLLEAESGFLVLGGGRQSLEPPVVVHRGIDAEQAAAIEDNAALLLERRGAPPPDETPGKARFIEPSSWVKGSAIPAATRLLARWPLDGGGAGLLGLGPRRSQAKEQRPYAPDVRLLLQELLDLLNDALGRAFLAQRLAAMGTVLATRNLALGSRIYQQETLIQALSEMSELSSSKELLDSYQLFLAGAAGAGKGYAFVMNRAGALRLFVGRGVARGSLDADGLQRLPQTLASHLFANPGAKTGWLRDPCELRALGLPDECPGLWFIADEDAFGFAGVGQLPDQAPLAPDLCETMLALTNAFVACLRNARLLESQRELNAALEARNEELARTIEQLTHARVEIVGLQKAKAKIKELVSQELLRVGKASWIDFALVFAVSLGVGFLFNWANPSGVDIAPAHWSRPAPPEISAQEAVALAATGGAALIDARPQESFKIGRAAGALNLTPALFDFMYGMRVAKIPPEQPLLVYGATISRRYDAEVAGLLLKRGRKSVMTIAGGLDAWQKAGGKVQ